MKPALTVLSIIGIILLVLTLSILGRGVDTASKMADQTVFNASKNVWTYEQFYKQYESYKGFEAQIVAAKQALEELKTSGTTSGQAYDALVMEIAGARQMKTRIANEYNSMSSIAYQGTWKGVGLPERLDP